MTHSFKPPQKAERPNAKNVEPDLAINTGESGMTTDIQYTEKKTRLIDLTGKVFGRWTVISRAANSPGGQAMWNCVCDCGNETTVMGNNLRSGKTQSCGCYSRQRTSERCRKVIDGVLSTEHSLYRTWGNMLTRCSNPSCPQYHNYGGRGIKVCDRWMNSFADFVADVGARPSPEHSIDRIDNDGDYAPGNVRWATRTEQNRNSRHNHIVALHGERMTLSEAAERLNAPYERLKYFLRTNPDFLSPTCKAA